MPPEDLNPPEASFLIIEIPVKIIISDAHCDTDQNYCNQKDNTF